MYSIEIGASRFPLLFCKLAPDTLLHNRFKFVQGFLGVVAKGRTTQRPPRDYNYSAHVMSSQLGNRPASDTAGSISCTRRRLER